MSKVDFSGPLFFLNVIGMHPFKNDRFSEIRKYFVLAVFSVTIVSAVLEVTLNSRGLDTYARASESLVPFCQLTAKMMVLVLCKKEFAQLLDDSKQFWPLDAFGALYETQPRKYHTFLKKFFQVYSVMIGFTCVQFVVEKFVFKKKEPITISFGESKGLDPTSDRLYSFLHTMTSLSTINLINGFDGLFFYFIGHILSELQMVKVAFGNCTNEAEWDEKERFRTSAQHHSFVLGFIDRFNSVVCHVLLVQHMSCLFSICFELFLMIKDGLPPDFDRVSKCMPFIISFTLQAWTFCFSGHLLIELSSEIPNEIFYNDWDRDYDYENVRGRVISMGRGQRASKLTLGKFGDLDLESFKLVMQKTFSFFTFFNAMVVEK